MQGYFSVGLGSHKAYREHRQTIEQLTRAINRLRTVQMRYYTASRDVTSSREVDPYHLRYAQGGLYLIAYCHWRKDVLLFAVNRIQALTITKHPYQLPLDFDIDEYVRDALMIMRGKPIEVELYFDRPTAAWVKDRQWHPSQRATLGKDGGLTLTLQVAETRELTGWVLSFGSEVGVLKPASLRESVRDEARKIAQGE